MDFNKPLVSIIMPAYNVADYIEKSINSILNQSFQNFELLIVDDKSCDNTLDIIYKFNDPRLKLFKNNKNIGQSLSKNALINIAKGEYIAFMDADDECHQDKIKIQYTYLEKHKDICGAGTFAELIDGENKEIGNVTLPISSEAIKVHTLFYPCFVHPSIMVRRRVFYEHYKLFYNIDYLYAQDYELYTRMVHKVTMINIPEYLYYIRKWPFQVSKIKNSEQIDYFIKALKDQLSDVLKIGLNENQLEIIRITCRNREKKTLTENGIEVYFMLLKQIWFSNLKFCVYDNKLLKVFLMQRYLDAFSLLRGDYSRYLFFYLKFEKILFQGANFRNRLKMTKRYLLDIKRKI